jgi:aminoglycoside 3-N-acetyltransferase
LGHVEGGPEAVIDALLDALGRGGTLLMPAYPVVGDWIAYVHSDPLFDPRRAPSSMGKITDTFWRRPGVLRSLHPTHSVAAFGPQARYLVRDHEKSPSPCGDPSPFHKLVELDGRILHLGSPFCNTTSMHVVEDIMPGFPRQVYLNEMIKMRFLDHGGVEHAVPVKIHDPVTAATRLEKIPEKEREIYQHCRRRGVVRTGKIGRATIHLIEARPLEDLLEELARGGITIYA